MMCYKDMTFCTYYKDCKKADTCHRPLTPAVEQKAKRWWGNEEAPISRFAEKPDCHEKQK